MAGVGHQHAIAAGQRQIGGQRSALVAALFLDDLDKQHLAALDHVLDLVAAAQVLALAAELVGGRLIDRRAVRAGTGIFGADVGFIGFELFGGLIDEVAVMMLVSVIAVVEFSRAQPLFLGGVLGFLAQQGVPIRLGDLVIVRMDFAEGQEAVAVAAIVDERRLERRFYPGDFGEIDIAFELLVLGGFEVKLLDPVSLDDRDPGLFRVARIDQHAHGH